jgi:hypothetical protein
VGYYILNHNFICNLTFCLLYLLVIFSFIVLAVQKVLLNNYLANVQIKMEQNQDHLTFKHEWKKEQLSNWVFMLIEFYIHTFSTIQNTCGALFAQMELIKNRFKDLRL